MSTEGREAVCWERRCLIARSDFLGWWRNARPIAIWMPRLSVRDRREARGFFQAAAIVGSFAACWAIATAAGIATSIRPVTVGSALVFGLFLLWRGFAQRGGSVSLVREFEQSLQNSLRELDDLLDATLRVDAEGIEFKTSMASFKYSWTGLDRLVESETHVLVLPVFGLPLAIPRSALGGPADLEALWTAVGECRTVGLGPLAGECPNCRYALDNLLSLKCPECGSLRSLRV